MKIGFISLPLAGHLNPMTALARKLCSRGHEIIFIGVPDAGPSVRAAGLNFDSYCEEEFPAGACASALAPVARIHGMAATRWTIASAGGAFFEAASRNLPRLLAETGVEALVLDTIHMYLEVVPMSMGIPYAHVWAILNIDFSGTTLPSVVSGRYEDILEARTRNVEELQKSDNAFFGWCNLSLGKLHGRPLVYASLGTLVNGLDNIYKTILPAVGRISEIQVVLAKGNNIELADLGPIPSNVIVVDRAPQLELLRRATLSITHAGLNTALESLAYGVPMVAIPIGYDQFGVAARIAYHGVGESLGVDDLSVDALHALIQRVLNNHSYREKAQYFRNIIAQRRGLEIAAEAIERAFESELASCAMAVSRS